MFFKIPYRFFSWVMGSLLLAGLAIFPVWHVMSVSSAFIIPKQKLDTPQYASVAIVFGAAVYGSKPSAVFADRLTVAANLYKSGMVRKILVSGDNSTPHYNEPKAGEKFLLQKGVKQSDILLDYAGFRSYDTCLRAKKIFGINDAFLVSQEFHLPRIVFLCQHSGIVSTGISADMRTYSSAYKNYFREYFATQLAFYQVYFLNYQPQFLGEEEPIDK